MRILAGEHIPPATVSALRGEGHDIAVVGDDTKLGSEDTVLSEYARDTECLILSEDTDFLGASPELRGEEHPDVPVYDTAASLGEIAASIGSEAFTGDLTQTVLCVPGNWL